MTIRFRFAKDADGAPIMSESELAAFTAAVPEPRGLLRVTHEVRQAADDVILSLARKAAFEHKHDIVTALRFVVESNPILLRLSRAPGVPAAEAEVT